MTYESKFLKCSKCGSLFNFSAGEQGFYAFKGISRGPKLCRPCRQAEEAAYSTTSTSSSYGSRSSRK